MNKVFSIGLTVVLATLFQSCTNQKEKIMESNKVTWFNIPTDNLEKSAKFYNSAFGWKIEPLTKEDNDDFSFHTMVNSESDKNYLSNEKGTINGCLVKRKIGLTMPCVMIEVDNLDDAIKRITEAGGEIVTEKILMKSTNGIFVLAKDPEGNFIDIFQSL
jgi:predicted enzyme related to lactoylglutathione lyase